MVTTTAHNPPSGMAESLICSSSCTDTEFNEVALLDSNIEFYFFEMKRSSLSGEILDKDGRRLGYIETPIFKRTIKILDGDGTSNIVLLKKRLLKGTGLSRVHWGDLLDSDKKKTGHIKFDNPVVNLRNLNVWLEDLQGKKLLDVEAELPLRVERLTYKAMIRDSEGNLVADIEEARSNTVVIRVLDKNVDRRFLLPLVLSVLLINQEKHTG